MCKSCKESGAVLPDSARAGRRRQGPSPLATFVEPHDRREVTRGDVQPRAFPPKIGQIPAYKVKPSFIPDSKYNYIYHTENLRRIVLNLAETTRHCFTNYLVKGCGCGRHILPQSCMRSDCEKCAPFISNNRAKKAFKRLRIPNNSHGIRPTVIYTVFTIPPRFREEFCDKLSITKLRAKIWQILKKFFSGLYGVTAIHPIGDEDPTIFHPHLNFLWVQTSEGNPFIDEKLLKSEYRKLFGAHKDSAIDVWTGYASEAGIIRKWLNYALRTFPEFAKFCGSIVWYGDFPLLPDMSDWLCSACGQPFKILGTIDHYKVQAYEESGYAMGRDPPWYNDDNLRRLKIKSIIEE